MDTSDDPVVDEVSRAVKKVDTEVSRVASKAWEEAKRQPEKEFEEHSRITQDVVDYTDEIILPVFGEEGPVTKRKREKLEEKALFRSQQIGPPATGPSGPSPVPTRADVTGFSFGTDSRKKKRQAASVLTRDWLPPTLGTPGLLGVA